jgi:hypothetical protein
MSADKLEMVDRPAQVDRAAKAMPHVDINSLMTPCPASQGATLVDVMSVDKLVQDLENVVCADERAIGTR